MRNVSSDSSLISIAPDDDADRNLRASPRKPGLLAVAGLRVPAKPIWIGGTFLLSAIAVLALDAVRQPEAPNEAPLLTIQTATINSRPEGVAVSVDGMFRGTTPLKLTLPIGEHFLKAQKGEDSRSISISVEPGMAVSQFMDFGPGQSAQAPGAVDVSSTPPGAGVRIDGIVKGKTPLVVSDRSVGEHTGVPDTGDAPVERRIRVAHEATTSVVVSSQAGTAAPAFGWLSITSPIELQVVEKGQVIGATSTDRLVVLAGQHEFELQNPTFGFRSSLSVQVPAGKVVTTSVMVPKGSLSVNAVPWADVLLDGQAVGQTPLGSIPVMIGQHEIVLRHPQLGERQLSVFVTASGPARVGVDLRK